jgi:hypothetical protein
MLQSRLGSFEGLRAADLFAGTGALGIEGRFPGARPRACSSTAIVYAAAAIVRNLQTVGADGRGDVRTQAVEHATPPSAPCDIVFLDHPTRRGWRKPRSPALPIRPGWPRARWSAWKATAIVCRRTGAGARGRAPLRQGLYHAVPALELNAFCNCGDWWPTQAARTARDSGAMSGRCSNPGRANRNPARSGRRAK